MCGTPLPVLGLNVWDTTTSSILFTNLTDIYCHGVVWDIVLCAGVIIMSKAGIN